MRKRSQRFDGQHGNALQSIFGIYKLIEFIKNRNVFFRRSYFNTKRPQPYKWKINKFFQGIIRPNEKKIDRKRR